MAYSDLVSLAQTTDLILDPLKYSISAAEKEEITSIRQHALSLVSFLEEFPEKARGLEGKIRDVATEAEDIIEYFMWEQIDAISKGLGPSRVECGQQLRRAREEIGSIAGDMMELKLPVSLLLKKTEAVTVAIGTESFALEKRRGKKCYMIGARELAIALVGNSQYWEWKPCADSRFSEVVELKWVCWLDIRVIIKTQMLSSNTTYAVYLVYKLAEKCCRLESANAFVKFMSDEDARETSIIVHLQQGSRVQRDDGWMEVEMGSFYNDDDGGEVDARLLGIDGILWKSGLILEGLEFRPKTRSNNLGHEPPYVLNQSQTISVEDMSGKKCCMMGARELAITWSNTNEYWQWTARADSRFSVVAELKEVCWLEISVKIKTHNISSNTAYAAYLVFKLAEGCYGLESANAAFRLVRNGVTEETRTVVHLQQRADDEDGCQERRPVHRDDGWMEVEMGSFYNDDDDDDDDDGEAEARLLGVDGQNWKSGLIVEGIEFRPMRQSDPQQN